VNKKLKLTKLTVANLDRVKGGITHCACQWTTGDGVPNKLNLSNVTCVDPCPVLVSEPGC
jgi:hypothetical protein